MPDWIEPISREKVKASKQLPVIELRWEETTVPSVPVFLPIAAYLNVTTEGIQLHAERREDSTGYPEQEIDLQFPKEDIICVDIFLTPGPPDDTDIRFVQITDYSRAVIRHRDPFDVVPYFESTFTAHNDYWLRALAKAIKDRLGVKQTFSEVKISTP